MRIAVVHGIGQEFSGPASMASAVAPVLRDGVSLAGRTPPEEHAVACAFYGHEFFPSGARAAGVLPLDETDVDAGFEAELLIAWWEQAARLDPTVPEPSTVGRGPAGFVASRPLTLPIIRRVLNALSHGRHFARVSEPLLVFSLKQVRRYFAEDELRQRVRAVAAAAVDDRTRVLVGHSLGRWSPTRRCATRTLARLIPNETSGPIVLASSRAKDLAGDGAFVAAFKVALSPSGCPADENQPLLDLAAGSSLGYPLRIVQGVSGWFSRGFLGPLAVCSWPGMASRT